MDLLRTRKDKSQIHLLCKDHIPNFAMKNEFQTLTFSLKLNHLEIHEEEYYGYIIEEGGVFLCVDVTIKNLTNETLFFAKDTFYIMYDMEGPFEPEEFFHVEGQFQDELTLQPYSNITGKFIYIISHDAKKIAFKYYESYDDQYPKEYRLRYRITK